ncbi:MAG: crossover junction endodeoxyribonuclease RuvC [Nanoarchaeota archaeon]
MKLLTLDLSLNHTGVAVFKDEKFLKSLVVEPNLKKKKDELLTGEVRISFILDVIKQVVKEYSGFDTRDIVVIEGPSFNSKGRSTIDIGELHGVVKHYFYENKVPVVIVPPKTLKKWVTDNGNSDKNQMLLQTYKRWKIEFSNDNECDAFCLGKYYLDVIMK